MKKNINIEKYTSHMDSNGYVIYGRDNCRYCLLALELLRYNKIEESDITYIKINDINKRKEFYNYINYKLELHTKTVPQIFYNGNHIGGYDSLCNFFTNKN